MHDKINTKVNSLKKKAMIAIPSRVFIIKSTMASFSTQKTRVYLTR